MNKEEIIEGNKIIAEFMGGKLFLPKWEIIQGGNQEYYQIPSGYNNDGLHHNFHNEVPDSLKYHSSWDWLMPVVGKIESVGWTVIIHKGLCYILSDNYPNTQEEFANKSNNDKIDKLELCWCTVVDFIKWHNTK